jgi:excinuclease UvrABC nuclease subunit
VLYIGKADALRRRVRQYMAFGAGRPVGHWGGRLIWQLADSDALLVAWRETAEPLRVEAELLNAFADVFGSLPFANLRR